MTMSERCDGGPACPNFAGYLPLGDHGWYHRRRSDCIPAARVVPTTAPAPTLQLAFDLWVTA